MSDDVSVEPFRRFVHVELPFLVHTSEVYNGVPIADARVRAHQQGEVARFLPPTECVAFLQDKSHDQSNALRGDEGPAKGRQKKKRGEQEEEEEEGSRENEAEEHSASSNASSSVSDPENENENTNAKRKKNKTEADATREAEVDTVVRAHMLDPAALDVGNKNKYITAPVAHLFKGTDWASPSSPSPLADPPQQHVQGVSGAMLHSATHQEGPLERARRSDAAVEARERAQQRRLAFPSCVPQLLLKGYYRNDLLLQITEQRRVRRWRHKQTGEVVEHLPMAAHTDRNAGEKTEEVRQENATCHAVTDVKVVGVVSREVEISRPADFTFALWQQEEQPQHDQEDESRYKRRQRPPETNEGSQAPEDDLFGTRRHLPPEEIADLALFPPRAFTSLRSLAAVHYEPGRRPNESLLRYVADHPDLVPHSCSVRLSALQRATAKRDRADDDDAPSTLTTVLTIDQDLPPPRRQDHVDYLTSLTTTPDGAACEEPIVLRTVRSLFAAQPVWMQKNLVSAALETGQCPQSFVVRRIIAAMSYTLEGGPYGRLRVRYDYNPFEQDDLLQMVLYQRHTVRLLRRSPIGVLLRDLSRSPHLAQVLRILMQRAKRRQEQEEQHKPPLAADAPPAAPTLLPYAQRYASVFYSTVAQANFFCRLVQNGSLFFNFQLFEMGRDDRVLHRVLAEVEAHYGTAQTEGHTKAPDAARAETEEKRKPRYSMSAAQRATFEGWLTPEQFARLREHMRELVHRFLTEEVIPLLEKFTTRREERERPVPPSPSAVAAAPGEEENKEHSEDADSHFSYSGNDDAQDGGEPSSASNKE